jgi:hypothetical protein
MSFAGWRVEKSSVFDAWASQAAPLTPGALDVFSDAVVVSFADGGWLRRGKLIKLSRLAVGRPRCAATLAAATITQIKGDPGIYNKHMIFPKPGVHLSNPDSFASSGMTVTGLPAVNAIKSVVAAPPGTLEPHSHLPGAGKAGAWASGLGSTV